MRMRHKPFARPELEAWPYFINDPALQRGNWAAAFSNPQLPLRVEMGCGKGGFIAQLALRDTAYNFLGLDIKNEMLLVAKRNIQALCGAQGPGPCNVRLAAANIERLGTVFDEGDTVDRIYINFCNPWYKSGHAKHRLTHPRQLVQYRQALCEGGEIYFKTDDLPLFKDSLRYFEYAGFALQWCSMDLHHQEPPWNIRTEHEQMYASEGIPIKACIVKKITKKLDYNQIKRLKNI